MFKKVGLFLFLGVVFFVLGTKATAAMSSQKTASNVHSQKQHSYVISYDAKQHKHLKSSNKKSVAFLSELTGDLGSGDRGKKTHLPANSTRKESYKLVQTNPKVIIKLTAYTPGHYIVASGIPIVGGGTYKIRGTDYQKLIKISSAD
ncbi:MAG: hypothetical protein ABF804_07120 [Liquorilactobacillus ghanensis]|uniref:hypothetical protein n=1 Tax=Liquorilactobacillus ghanensis TaxID=399370 RepID=UPI0039E74800